MDDYYFYHLQGSILKKTNHTHIVLSIISSTILIAGVLMLVISRIAEKTSVADHEAHLLLDLGFIFAAIGFIGLMAGKLFHAHKKKSRLNKLTDLNNKKRNPSEDEISDFI